jgi:hypothetical protein
VVLTSRWFSGILAVLQTARYIAFVGYDYWAAERSLKHFDAGQYIRRDLARPLFEPSGFCGGWTHFGFGQTAVFGLDLPAYMLATLLHSLVNWQSACVETLATARGQILVAVFVPLVWFLAGLSIRRIAQHRWRPRATGSLSRIVFSIGLIPLLIGLLAILLSIAGIFVSEPSMVVRMVGTAFWMIWLGVLSAERLQTWPFAFGRRSGREPVETDSGV